MYRLKSSAFAPALLISFFTNLHTHKYNKHYDYVTRAAAAYLWPFSGGTEKEKNAKENYIFRLQINILGAQALSFFLFLLLFFSQPQKENKLSCEEKKIFS